MTWKDITVEQFLEIQKLKETNTEEDFAINVVSYLFNCDADKIPISDYLYKIKELEFLANNFKEKKVQKEYIINNRKYQLVYSLDEITTAMYFDFANYAKEKDNMVDVLSIVLIPSNHKYSDGYNMEQTKADIRSMPIEDANAIYAFFLRIYQRFVKVLTKYMMRQLKMTKEITTEEKTNLINQLKILMESCR